MINQIHIEGTSFCNGRCYFCPNKHVSRNGYLDYATFIKIVDEGMDLGCNNFCPFRVNEPLLFPEIFEWLDHIKHKGATVDLFTNASALTKKVTDRLYEYSGIINAVVFSYHGYNPEIYAKSMGLEFYQTRDNILYFMSKKHNFYTEIYMLYPENQITQDIVDKYKSLWEGVSFDSIQVKGFANWGGNIPLPTRLSNYKKENKEIKRIPCTRFLNQVDIDCNGDVVLCCLDAYSEEKFGNIRDQSLKDILNGEKRKRYIDYHNKKQFEQISLCNDCSTNLE